MRGRHGEHDRARCLGRFGRAVPTPKAHGAQPGLAAAPLLGDVPRSRREDLELLPEEADGRGQPAGVVGEGEGDGTDEIDGTAAGGCGGCGWPTHGGRRPFRVRARMLHSLC